MRDQDQRQQRPGPVRLLVTGGRNYRDQKACWAALDKLLHERGIIVLMHGACPVGTGGADRLAHNWCFARGVPVLPFPPIERIDGAWPSAGPLRNTRMLQTGKPTAAVAFPGAEGTDDMVAKLRRARIPVWIPYGGVIDGEASRHPPVRQPAQQQQQRAGGSWDRRRG